MEEITCPNCNVDVDPEELRRNNLCCPTCGHDLSDTDDVEDLKDKDAAAADDDEEEEEESDEDDKEDKDDDDEEEDE